MNAIIKQGGHQYNVTEGDVIRVDQISKPEGSKIELDRPFEYPQRLSLGNEAGCRVTIAAARSRAR